MLKAEFTHNCNQCVFERTVMIGRVKVDWYNCTASGHHSVVGRYGEAKDEYWAFPVDLLEKLPPSNAAKLCMVSLIAANVAVFAEHKIEAQLDAQWP